MKSLLVTFLVASCLVGLAMAHSNSSFMLETVNALETLAATYPVLTTTSNPWLTTYNSSAYWPAHCNWTGIRCGVNGSVDAITFDSRINGFQLTGNFSQAWFDIPHLFDLILRAQNFYGTVPTKILVNSFALTSVTISNCNLQGPFPPFVNGSTGSALTRLDFSFNKFTGSIPTQFFNNPNYTRMTSIDFSHNQFSGTLNVPNCGTNLQNLFVNDNQLSGTIPCLGMQTAVDLSNNRFSGDLPVFSSNITELHLDNNRFSGFGTLFTTARTTTNPLVFTFSNNPINQPLPTTIVSGLNFYLLDMSSCGISGSFSSAWQNVALQYLVANNNSISALWSPSSTQLTQLVHINMNDNPVVSIPGLGAAATALKYLLCHNCQIAGPISSDIYSIPGLVALDLGSNQLSGALPAFASISTLIALDLSSNSLSGEPLPLLQSMSGTHPLLYIDVSHNNFQLCNASTFGTTLNFQVDPSAFCSAVCQTFAETISAACIQAWTHCTLAQCTPDGTLPPDGGITFPLAPVFVPSPQVPTAPSDSAPSDSSTPPSDNPASVTPFGNTPSGSTPTDSSTNPTRAPSSAPPASVQASLFVLAVLALSLALLM